MRWRARCRDLFSREARQADRKAMGVNRMSRFGSFNHSGLSNGPISSQSRGADSDLQRYGQRTRLRVEEVRAPQVIPEFLHSCAHDAGDAPSLVAWVAQLVHVLTVPRDAHAHVALGAIVLASTRRAPAQVAVEAGGDVLDEVDDLSRLRQRPAKR